MPDFLKEALAMKDETIAMRRYLHSNAEVGFELPKTSAFIKKKLEEFGIPYSEPVQCGVVANVGNGNGKTILIRADIDALPHLEESGEPFACTTGASHSCGHDIHTSALLAAAKMLKAHENEIEGTVKLCFQPDEEAINGAKAMIAAGVMENPHVDAAISMHTNLPLPTGHFNVLPGTYLSSSDMFRIIIKGRGCHGSAPENGVDPVLVGAKIVEAVQTVSTREISALFPNIITFGYFHSGDAPNIIPETAELKGTIRAFDRNSRDEVVKRFCEVVKGVAETFRAEATVTFTSQTPTTYNDPELTEKLLGYMRELVGEDIVHTYNLSIKGSDDFAYYSDIVPGVMYHVGMGTVEDGYIYSLHNPHVRFDENALPNCAAAFAHITYRWLKDNK